jgi:glycosyltransferase involved in cell wall biosynthesis
MKSDKPLISAMITVFNGEKYIAEALQSIMSQNYLNFQIIVVDDGSTDHTKTVIQNSGVEVSYFYQEHGGIARGKNLGISHAKGDYFAFLDADDFWLNEKTNKQINLLLDDPSLDLVFGNVKQFYSPDLTAENREKYLCPENSYPGIHSGTMLIRRESFFKVGLFDTKWHKGIFNDWYLRAAEAGLRTYTFDDIFMMRRIHENNHGIVNRDKSIEYVRMLKASLNRKKNMPHGQTSEN